MAGDAPSARELPQNHRASSAAGACSPVKHSCVDVMVTPVARFMGGAVLTVQLTEVECSGQAVLANEGRERIAMAEKDRSHGIEKGLVPGREEGREQ